MRLVQTTYEHPRQNQRWFIDGKRVTQAVYEAVRDAATIRDCFSTERVSLSGGFAGFRFSQEVR